MRGFTLIELAIVLVIIGLITGGVMQGASMIRAADLRTISGDLEKYVSAANLFRDRYNAVPGDMHNATYLWGAKAGGTADGEDAACLAHFDATNTPTRLTCNGDGNGHIEDGNTGINFREMWTAWQHLSNAGLIDDMFTGQGRGSTLGESKVPIPGVNAPKGPMGSEAIVFRWWGTGTPTTDKVFPGVYNNTLIMGRNSDANDPFLMAPDMAAIDSKIDDGKPGVGVFRSFKFDDRPDCVTSDDPAAAQYQLTSTDPGCTIVMITGI